MLFFSTSIVKAQRNCLKGDCINGFGIQTGMYDANYSKYTGNFKEGKFHCDDGELIIKKDNYTLKSKGKFVNGNFFEGIQNIKWKTNNKNSPKEEINSGFFENGKLKNGEAKFILTDGRIINYEIDNFIKKTSISNILNNYSVNEISGPANQLLKINQSGTKLYLELDFTNDVVISNCVFDTGAHGLKLNKKTYNELRKQNLVERLEIDKTKSRGVGGTTDIFYVEIKSVIIGDFKVDNVIATVDLSNNDPPILVGINFFDKFKNVIWNKKDNTLELFK